jgi:hypothetical protein
MVTDSVALPQKFKEVVENISLYNSEEFQKKRKAFAQANSYESHLKKIEQLITENASIE